MNGHVDGLLVSYIERRLNPTEASQVYRHIATCSACRFKLSVYERLSADLRVLLKTSPAVPPIDTARWWRRVVAKSQPRAGHSLRLSLLTPVLLSGVLLVLPFTVGISDFKPKSPIAAGGAEAAYETVQPVDTLPHAATIPQPATYSLSYSVSATQAPRQNVATAAPAPLAPTIR